MFVSYYRLIERSKSKLCKHFPTSMSEAICEKDIMEISSAWKGVMLSLRVRTEVRLDLVIHFWAEEDLYLA